MAFRSDGAIHFSGACNSASWLDIKRGSMMDEVICSVCGKAHSLDQSELYFRLPDDLFELSEEDRTRLWDISDDVCALDRERFFIRGLLPLPVKGRTEVYRIGMWAEVSVEVFGRIYQRWTDSDQAVEPRLSGTPANQLPLQTQNTRALAVSIQLIGPKSRPEFFVQAPEHHLHREQTDGIDEHRALEYTDRRLLPRTGNRLQRCRAPLSQRSRRMNIARRPAGGDRTTPRSRRLCGARIQPSRGTV
jgi:hypothetical protein